jgi:hypothetical protein
MGHPAQEGGGGPKCGQVGRGVEKDRKKAGGRAYRKMGQCQI